jgi:hypothetical protein
LSIASQKHVITANQLLQDDSNSSATIYFTTSMASPLGESSPTTRVTSTQAARLPGKNQDGAKWANLLVSIVPSKNLPR